MTDNAGYRPTDDSALRWEDDHCTKCGERDNVCKCARTSNERSLLKQTADLLREMREDIFQRGTLSGRSQRAGDDLLRRIDTILITPVETTRGISREALMQGYQNFVNDAGERENKLHATLRQIRGANSMTEVLQIVDAALFCA